MKKKQEKTQPLFWHCIGCGDHEVVESTGDPDEEYSVGDSEKCITCGESYAHVMTKQQAAFFEQLKALGMTTEQALDHAYQQPALERQTKGNKTVSKKKKTNDPLVKAMRKFNNPYRKPVLNQSYREDVCEESGEDVCPAFGKAVTEPSEDSFGYHRRTITKAQYGSAYKVQEECEEFIDSIGQGNPVMAITELSDIIGAIKGYLEFNHPSILLDDLITMADTTKRAFASGERS